MHPVFSKPLDTVTAEDIASLVAEGYPEDAAVEFKDRIPHKGGRDTWYEDGGIGDYGRNQILEEVVALANTHGGHVVLGIQESSGHPHRAVGIEPIPRCAALADVSRKQIRDCIEPKI